MDFYNLGYVSWWESQCYYHALAHLGREGVIVCAPNSPYICLGIHDDLNQEVDLEFCKQNQIPTLRRETGGGVVYLDSKQIFYQLVLRQDNEKLPFRRERFYRTFLEAPIEVYRKLGVPAEYKPPADLVAKGAKCSGNAAGDIGLGVAFVGNILLDFNYNTMANLLRSPNFRYKECLAKSMRNNMTTVSDWSDKLPSYDHIASLLEYEYSKIFASLTPKKVDRQLHETALQFRDKLTSSKWLEKRGRKTVNRMVKITEGLYLHEGQTKTKSFVALVRDDIVEEYYLIDNGKEIKAKKEVYEGLFLSELLLEPNG
ncbi:MAG TPA: biotin/lipoate A/B protein ligase family protein [Syntrophomonadaceae bacterium]|nr:biotin/lipoate A/B protein ligase family protein [Syntrophomonadaceae bacterium]